MGIMDKEIEGGFVRLHHVFAHTVDQRSVVVVQELGRPLSDMAFVGKQRAKQNGEHGHVLQPHTFFVLEYAIEASAA